MGDQLTMPWGSGVPVAERASAPKRRHGDDWRLDAPTRRAGLEGLARARAALAATVEATKHGAHEDAA